MAVAPGKAPRWIIWPYVIAILMVAGWCGYWVYAKNRLESGLDQQAAALKARGYDVGWTAKTVGGFPFRFYVRLTAPHMAEPSGWAASAPALEAETMAYNPTVVVLTAPEGMTLRRPGGATWKLGGKVLRMSVGGYARTPPRISLEGVGVTVADGAGGPPPLISAIDRFELHLRPGDGDTADLFGRIDKATVTEGVLARVAQGAPVTFGVEGKLTKASGLHGRGWPGLIRNWSAGGGQFNVTRGGIATGESVLTLRESHITADRDGRAAGRLRLTLGRGGEGMLALGAIGILPDETAAVGSGLAGAGSLTGSPLEASIAFKDGKAWLGPLPLGPAPRFY